MTLRVLILLISTGVALVCLVLLRRWLPSGRHDDLGVVSERWLLSHRQRD
jgi:hypothetical protein